MRIRTASDATYTLIAWLPLVALALAVFWVFTTGLAQFEAMSFGTEFFIGNDETSNALPPISTDVPGDEELLAGALGGDVAQMEAALNEVETRHAAADAVGVGATG